MLEIYKKFTESVGSTPEIVSPYLWWQSKSPKRDAPVKRLNENTLWLMKLYKKYMHKEESGEDTEVKQRENIPKNHQSFWGTVYMPNEASPSRKLHYELQKPFKLKENLF